MSAHRFRFLARLETPGQWVVEGDEFLHLSKVLRLVPGDGLEVMDGLGHWAVGVYVGPEGEGKLKSARVKSNQDVTDAPSAAPLAIAIGALKPGDIDEILAPLVELGVDQFHIYQQQDTAKARLAEKAVERWRRIILAAVKQSKRAWIPVLMTHGDLPSLAAFCVETFPQRLVLDENADAVLGQRPRTLDPVCALLGGEKGLSEAEKALLSEHGFASVRLGPHILRATTAAIAATAVLTLGRPI